MLVREEARASNSGGTAEYLFRPGQFFLLGAFLILEDLLWDLYDGGATLHLDERAAYSGETADAFRRALVDSPPRQILRYK